MTETIQDQGTPVQEEAKRRFRVVSFIQRTGTRVQKRAVAAGKGAKALSGNAVKNAWGQIVEPYSVLKQIGVGMLLIGAGVALWYVAIMATIAVFAGTGSIILALLAGIFVYMVLARVVYLPLGIAGAGYLGRAQEQAYMPKGMRNVPIRQSGFVPA